MIKQLIFAGMALLLLSPVKGNEIIKPVLLSSGQLEPHEAAIANIDRPTSLLQAWANISTNIDSNTVNHTYLNVFQMIRGRIAGVQVSGSTSNYRVRIRGASGPPLIAIDGMVFIGCNDACVNNLLLNISPADVEYIEVSKRISATAIYGYGSANGVIVVRTRSAE